jgi:hypothetical protein
MYRKKLWSADELTSPGESGLASLVLTWYSARGPLTGHSGDHPVTAIP